MIRKLLVTLDGSKASESVLPYVENLLMGSDANLTLLRVLPKDLLDESREAKAYLRKTAEALNARGAYVDTRIKVGKPAEEILKLAEEEHFNLVALCSRGKSGVKRMVLGSTAEEVMRRLPCPALVVHPLEKGEKAGEFRRIMVPLDGSHRSASILEVAAEIAEAQESKLHFVTVVSPRGKEELPAEVATRNLFHEQEKLKKRGIDADIAVLFGNPALEILAFAESKKADLLAVATHGRTGLDRVLYGSVAEEILRKGKLPLLILRTVAIPKDYPFHGLGLEKGKRTILKLRKVKV